MKHKIELEGIEKKFEATIKTKQWKQLAKEFCEATDVYIIGNGGLDSSHLAIDISKMLTAVGVEKYVHSPCNIMMVTGVANDYGFNLLYVKWLETFQKRVGKKSIVIGCSCSGRSKNVLSALHYATTKGSKAFLISGQKSDSLTENVGEVCLNTEYFHTTETLSMLMLYQLIHEAGGKCPLIKSEIERKSIASHISRSNDAK